LPASASLERFINRSGAAYAVGVELGQRAAPPGEPVREPVLSRAGRRLAWSPAMRPVWLPPRYVDAIARVVSRLRPGIGTCQLVGAGESVGSIRL